MRKLSVPEQHQLKVARSTMRMHCVGARIMGGPDHLRSVNIIRNLTGKVNNSLFSFSTGKIPPETLLFLGAELKRDIMSNGVRAWELTYHFSERQVDSELSCKVGGQVVENSDIGGWNHFWRQEKKKSGFHPMTREVQIEDPSNAGVMINTDAKIYTPARFILLYQSESQNSGTL